MQLKETSNQPYQPIDCSFYDRIEAAIVLRTPVLLEFVDADNSPVTNRIHLVNTRIADGEEFVILENGQEVRMDRIISLNGIHPVNQCS